MNNFELLVVEAAEFVQEVGCVNVAGSDVLKSALVLGDGKAVLEFFFPDFLFKPVALEVNPGKSQQQGHLLFNGDFPFGPILKGALNKIKSTGDIIIMHLDQGLDPMQFNISGMALEILAETDVAFFGLVVVLFR